MNPFADVPSMVKQSIRWEWRIGPFGWILVPVAVWSLAS